VAVKRSQILAEVGQINEAVDVSEQMVPRDVIINR
jgi:hypothetical protein